MQRLEKRHLSMLEVQLDHFLESWLWGFQHICLKQIQLISMLEARAEAIAKDPREMNSKHTG
jgi:hypothetical protein